MSLRALIVSEPGIDGVFRYVDGLCRHLLAGGAEVHLAFSDRRAGEGLADLVEEIRRRGGRTLNLGVGNRPGPADGPAFLALLRLARMIRPDVVHSHSSKAGALARPLRLFGLGRVHVYQPHAYAGMRPERGRAAWLYDAVERRLGRTGHTVACSDGEKAYALSRLGLHPARIETIHNGVDPSVFRPGTAEEKLRIRRALGLPAGTPILGFLGRSSPQKDPLTLYRALARVPSVHLFHVGQGELDSALAAEAAASGLERRLHRLPRLVPPAEFYRAIDGFILPSRYEGLSLAALEALASDLPVLLSRAAGNTDLLRLPLTHAWSADPGDVAGFAHAIAAWEADLPLARARNHREIAERKFHASSQFAAVAALYQRLLSGRTQKALSGTVMTSPGWSVTSDLAEPSAMRRASKR